MTDFTDGDYIDGPLLAEWIRPRIPATHSDFRTVDEQSLLAAVRRWELGSGATVASADRWLTFIGLHLSEVPDACWRKGTPFYLARSAESHPTRAPSGGRRRAENLAPSTDSQLNAIASDTRGGAESLEAV